MALTSDLCEGFGLDLWQESSGPWHVGAPLILSGDLGIASASSAVPCSRWQGLLICGFVLRNCCKLCSTETQCDLFSCHGRHPIQYLSRSEPSPTCPPPLLFCHQHSPSWPRDRRGYHGKICLNSGTWPLCSGPAAVVLSERAGDLPPHLQEFSWPLKVMCDPLHPLRMGHMMDFSGAGDRGSVPNLSLSLPLELSWSLPCVCLIKFCVVS